MTTVTKKNGEGVVVTNMDDLLQIVYDECGDDVGRLLEESIADVMNIIEDAYGELGNIKDENVGKHDAYRDANYIQDMMSDALNRWRHL